jgi:hypothetical protein
MAFAMASLPSPPAFPGNPSDKALHAMAFAILAGLAVLAFPRAHFVIIFVLLGIFGGVIELVQGIPQIGREASGLDWTVDLVATGLTLLIIGAIRKVSVGHRVRQDASLDD